MNQLLQDYRATLGGRVEDYFGTAYMEEHHKLPAETALSQTARGNNDHGLDGYCFDVSTGNLYLYQFKYSNDWRQFQASMRSLIKTGLTRVFSRCAVDTRENTLLQSLRADIVEFKPKVRNVYVRFVFTGNPKRAEESDTLKDLREQIEDRRYLLSECFERDVDMWVQFLSTTVKAPPPPSPPVAKFSIDIGGDILVEGPDAQIMHTGFISLQTLHDMFGAMGHRLFDRNIRAPLARRDGSKSTSVNQKITETLKRIVLEQELSPHSFSFIHNGVTLYAQRLIGSDGQYEITEPRILNGAQTVATLAQFTERYSENPKFQSNRGRLRDAKVLCKIIASAQDEFIQSVTVSTNRQNPVHPANLRANDSVQLQIADWLREKSFFYERQENSAAWQDPDELADQGISADRVIVMKRLGETFAVTDGKIERARNMNQLFDSDQQYSETFHEGRLAEDVGKVIICYKCRTYCHNTLAKELAVGRAAFVDRAKLLLWALVCQRLLNQKDTPELVDEFGTDLRMPEAFRTRLLKIAQRQVKPTLLWLVQQKEFVEAYREERYDFLRGDKAFSRSMARVLQEYGWRQTRLGRPNSLGRQARRAAAAV